MTSNSTTVTEYFECLVFIIIEKSLTNHNVEELYFLYGEFYRHFRRWQKDRQEIRTGAYYARTHHTQTTHVQGDSASSLQRWIRIASQELITLK